MSELHIKEKLIKIQSELKAPKGQFNKFGNYNYRNCEDILEALKPILKNVQAVITITDELVNIGDRYYIKSTVTLSDLEGEISTTSYAREEETKKGMDASQITGSASSYARKYALNGLFAIDDTKDADATNGHEKGKESLNKPNYNPPPQKPQSDPTITEVQLQTLMAMIFKLDDNEEYTKNLLKFYKISDLKDLKVSQYGKILKNVQGKLQ